MRPRFLLIYGVILVVSLSPLVGADRKLSHF
jgi:hypothetical protein